jgi:hypothetical protein
MDWRLNWRDGSRREPWAVPSASRRDTETAGRSCELVPGLYAEQAGRVDAQGIRKTARALRQVAPRAAEHHDIHETDAGRLELLAEQLEKYSEALIPPSFIAVLIVLAWITVTGVAIPLAFLPGLPGDSSKGWLLVAFCVGVVGLIAALGGQLSHLKRMGDIRWLRPEEYTQA